MSFLKWLSHKPKKLPLVNINHIIPSFIKWCVYVHACVHVCMRVHAFVCVWVCVCMCTSMLPLPCGGQSTFMAASPHFAAFPESGSLAHCYTTQVSWSTLSQFPISLSECWLQTQATALGFTWVLGIQVYVLTFMWLALYPLKHLPSSMNHIKKTNKWISANRTDYFPT